MGLVKNVVRAACLRTGRFERVFITIGSPNSWDWAEFQRRRGHHIGEGTTVNPAAQLMNDYGALRIGRNCSISYASFVTHSGGDRVIRDVWGYEVSSTRPIVVGDNCIIGANVIVMYGVTIGDNCVIGAGSYVCRDVPAGTVMRPPEAVAHGTTEAYVQRLRKRSLAGSQPAVAALPARPHSQPRGVRLPHVAWHALLRVAIAFSVGAMLVPSPFFN